MGAEARALQAQFQAVSVLRLIGLSLGNQAITVYALS